MTQEDKELLLKDLCSRLPYGVKVEYDNCACEVISIDKDTKELTIWKCFGYSPGVELENVKPYLFPISSMTEEQKEEFNTQSLKLQLQVIDEEIMYEKATEFEVDFYNKHHLDWRGLIPKGLAIDATDKNIY